MSCPAGSFWKGFGTYLGITVGYSIIASVPVVKFGQASVEDGGGIAKLECVPLS